MPGPANNLHHNLKTDTKYKFVYQIRGVHRKPRSGVALLLNVTNPPGRHGVDLIFSGRPEFGTTTIQSEWLESIEEVGPQTTCHIDRIVK